MRSISRRATARTCSRLLAALGLTLAVAACGGGGGGGTTGTGTGTGTGGGGGGTDPTTSLAPKASYSTADLQHFLARTHFGVKPADLAAVQQMGLAAYVTQMLQFPAADSTALEQSADALLVNATDPPALQGGFPTQGELAQRWLYLMQRNAKPFQEVLGLFWHDHFAASDINLESGELYFTKAYMDLFRGTGTGNLRTLLVQMARDSLMLIWLDGRTNDVTHPNENFAREFWELFTLGVDNGYTQADIVEGARGWTGWRERTNASTNQNFMQFDSTKHDAGSKSIFGTAIPGQNGTDDYQAMVDATLANRPVEIFIAKTILEYFCYANPPATLVNALGAILRQGNWELAPVLQTLFLSEAFYSAPALVGIAKSPVEEMLGFVHSTGMLNPERTVLDPGLNNLGHRPTQPPTVNGWPVADEWLSSQAAVDRANLVNTMLVQRTFQQQQGFSLASLLPPAPMTSLQVVDQLAVLLNVTLSATDRTQCASYLDTTPAGAADPFNSSNATHVDQRVRGLLYILTQHPTYAVR